MKPCSFEKWCDTGTWSKYPLTRKSEGGIAPSMQHVDMLQFLVFVRRIYRTLFDVFTGPCSLCTMCLSLGVCVGLRWAGVVGRGAATGADDVEVTVVVG